MSNDREYDKANAAGGLGATIALLSAILAIYYWEWPLLGGVLGGLIWAIAGWRIHQ